MVVIKSKSHPDLLFYGRGGLLTVEDASFCDEDDSLSSLVDVRLPTQQKSTTTRTTTAVIGNFLWKLLLAGEIPVVPEGGSRDDGIDWKDLKKQHSDVLSGASVEELQLYHEALTSIIILDESIDPRAAPLLERYNGRLTGVPSTITNELQRQAPAKFTAFVADFNDNLAYSMNQQASHRGIPSQPLPNSETTNEEWTTAVQDLESNLQSKLQSTSELDIQASFLKTEFQTIPQPAHVDYPWSTLTESGQQLWLAFFPLTTQGMILQLWPSLSSTSSSSSTKGQLVFVPLGKLLMVPSYTIHGGGFRTRCHQGSDHEHGNLRYHLYLATHGTTLPRFAQNVYTLPNDKRHELCEEACINANHLVAGDDEDDSLLMELLLD